MKVTILSTLALFLAATGTAVPTAEPEAELVARTFPPSFFTSTYRVNAVPGQVVNGTEPTGGLKGCSGTYDVYLNSEANIICYDIVIRGFRGDYESAARSATHLHEAPRGASGPPRFAFKNPQLTGNGRERRSQGCATGPFRTGLPDATTGQDTGIGFTVAQIEANPRGFFVDTHSSLAVPGAVRGQIRR